MTTRTTQSTIRFSRPFRLDGMEAQRPAGIYQVETDEELIESVSFPVWRRVETRLFLPGPPGRAGFAETITIDPLELTAAREADDAP
ncbi:MAG: hypothetical protein IPK81_18275 [Rhodospirillales bacterium]|nr:MAG: hypothetical protein IPK81_18275 [Rhodospirillales bacterium]